MNTILFIIGVLAAAVGNLCASQLAAVPVKEIPRELWKDFRRGGALSPVAIVVIGYFVLVHGFGMVESAGKPLRLIGHYLAVGFLSTAAVSVVSRWFERLESRAAKKTGS